MSSDNSFFCTRQILVILVTIINPIGITPIEKDQHPVVLVFRPRGSAVVDQRVRTDLRALTARQTAGKIQPPARAHVGEGRRGTRSDTPQTLVAGADFVIRRFSRARAKGCHERPKRPHSRHGCHPLLHPVSSVTQRTATRTWAKGFLIAVGPPPGGTSRLRCRPGTAFRPGDEARALQPNRHPAEQPSGRRGGIPSGPGE